MTYDMNVKDTRGENSGDMWRLFRGETANEQINIKWDDLCDPLKWQ
jgi:hypothetical protein